MANYVSQITPSSGGTYDIRELYPHVGTCGTAAATSAKTVTIGNFKLYTGAWVVVKFTYTNTAAAPGLTLNVDNTGPKSIKYKNADLTDLSMLAANKYTYFMYDGTNYQIVEPGYAAGTGISISNSTINHSNSITAQSASFVFKKLKYDAQGHITSTADVDASDLPSHTHPYLPLAGGTLTGRVTTTKALNYILTGTGTAGADKGSGQNPRYVPAKWIFNTGQTPSNGDIIFVKNPVAGHDYGVYISIDNGTTFHPATIRDTARLTTHYGGAGNYTAFIFRSDGSAASMIPLAGNTDGTRVTVTGGTWQGIDYYDSGNTYDRTSMQTRIYAGGVGVFRYSICAMNNAQRMEAFTTTGDENGSPTTNKQFNTTAKFMYPPVIMHNYANAVFSSGSVIYNNYLYEQYPSIDLRYSCNITSSAGFAQYKPVYLECTLNSDNTFSITSNGLTQTFVPGKYYILLGCMYNTSVYQLALFAQHPMFYYDGTNLCGLPQITQAEKTKLAGIAEGATKVESSSTNGKIKINGTDTTVYTHPTATAKSSGLYKITVDSTGHVTGTTSVAKGDIPALDYVPNTKAGVNAAINLLDTGSSTPVDADYYISQYVGGGTTTTTYYRRPMSALWSYVKGKADSFYAPIDHTHSLSIATDSGTNQVSMSANTKYKLTAGGNTFIFTTPTDSDTKNTAGSTDTSSKIYLIGATSQAANPQTYSDNEVYITSGVLTTKKVQVGGGSCTMEYNTTTQSLDFVFA